MLIDLSSNEPHITNHCPFCVNEWMDKVKETGECPRCGAKYSMQKKPGGEIEVGWQMSPVLSKIVSMLKGHGFRVCQIGMERSSTGCSFSFEYLSRFRTVTDFQLDYPFYA
jgi:hypothetical protein